MTQEGFSQLDTPLDKNQDMEEEGQLRTRPKAAKHRQKGVASWFVNRIDI
jgi:hypothetical protein